MYSTIAPFRSFGLWSNRPSDSSDGFKVLPQLIATTVISIPRGSWLLLVWSIVCHASVPHDPFSGEGGILTNPLIMKVNHKEKMLSPNQPEKRQTPLPMVT